MSKFRRRLMMMYLATQTASVDIVEYFLESWIYIRRSKYKNTLTVSDGKLYLNEVQLVDSVRNGIIYLSDSGTVETQTVEDGVIQL